jgi:hypothetical protein
MTFDVQSNFEHDGERYDAGDTFDGLTEKEARQAGLVPDVLAPNPGGDRSAGGSTKKGDSKKKDAKKDDDE